MRALCWYCLDGGCCGFLGSFENGHFSSVFNLHIILLFYLRIGLRKIVCA